MIILNRPSKDMFPKEYIAQSRWSIISILRLTGIIAEITASIVASFFTAGATIPLAIAGAGTAFNFGLDLYQYQNNQISGSNFALSTFIKIPFTGILN